ncbi:MAG TPA: hypothetical protein DCY79_02130 [Planctomycetaceae bacterium]|nr:hypothetical protein [Blastopirellula sp.]HAY78587.1 hypothetical protein [Planctomycetaceae bacterium]|tara:strand:+ start:448 stop:939 length:492 start_codon:yes stop_codon:yes gene_type:complete
MSARSVFRATPALFLSSLSLLAMLSGCCVHPLQNDRGPNFTRSFHGATLKPGETIELQGKNRDESWETFHTVRSSETPLVGWGGIEYYVWDCHRLSVPSRFWWDRYGISVNVCEVRMVDSSGQVMHTYSEQWTGDDLFLNPVEVWRAKGNPEFSLRLFQHREF